MTDVIKMPGENEAKTNVPDRKRRRLPQRARSAVTIVGAIIAFVIFWEVVLWVFDIPTFLVPTPAGVVDALITSFERNPTGRGSLLRATWSTYSAAIIAFVFSAVSGFVIAMVLARWKWLERAVKPYIVAFQTLPRIAIAPLFLIWFGAGLAPKVMLASLIAFFPVMVNTLAGLSSTPIEWVEWMKVHNASSWQIYWHVRVRSALPYIFAGLEVSMVFSILGVVVTEFVGASDGLGVVILQSQYALDVAGVFSVFVILVSVGLLLRLLLMSMRTRLLFWAERGDTTNL